MTRWNEVRDTDANQKKMLELAFKETGCGSLKWIELAHNTVFWPLVLFKITNIICITWKFPDQYYIVYWIKIHVDIVRLIYLKIWQVIEKQIFYTSDRSTYSTARWNYKLSYTLLHSFVPAQLVRNLANRCIAQNSPGTTKVPPYVFKCLKYETRNVTQTECVQ